MEPLSKSETKLIIDINTFLKEAKKLRPELNKMEKELRSFNFDIKSLKYYRYTKNYFKSNFIELSFAPNNDVTYFNSKGFYLDLSIDFYRLKEALKHIKQNEIIPGWMLKESDQKANQKSLNEYRFEKKDEK